RVAVLVIFPAFVVTIHPGGDAGDLAAVGIAIERDAKSRVAGIIIGMSPFIRFIQTCPALLGISGIGIGIRILTGGGHLGRRAHGVCRFLILTLQFFDA